MHYLELVFIFTLIWVVLNEKADLVRIISGAIISAGTIFFTNYYLLFEDYKRSYSIPLQSFIQYLGFLFIQIYKSGIAAIRIIIKGDGKVKITEYESKLSDELTLCLLANAITLTPGTVTIDKSGRKLYILHFDITDDSSGKRHDHALPVFEKILSRRAK